MLTSPHLTSPRLSPPGPHAGLTDSCRDLANSLLQFLNHMKLQDTLPRADPTPVRYTVQRLHALGQVRKRKRAPPCCTHQQCVPPPLLNCVIGVQDLRPRGQDVLKEELGYVVDKEMIATSTAIEEAVLRMDVSPGGSAPTDRKNQPTEPS